MAKKSKGVARRPPPSYPVCGAPARQRRRNGDPDAVCEQPAGWGTDHPGEGRCKFHGGATPVKSGRYSKVKRKSLRLLIEEFAQDEDPLDLLPELAAARALFQDFVNRHGKFSRALLAWHESYKKGDGDSKPTQMLDITDSYRILSEVTKIAERIERVKAQNAISVQELRRVFTELARIVEHHVGDGDVLQKIREDWLKVRVL